MVALYPMRLFAYIGSHKLTGEHIFEPVDTMVPAGCVLLLSNIAHGGHGIWMEKEALYRPVASCLDFLGDRNN